MACANAPKAVAWTGRVRIVIRQPFIAERISVIVYPAPIVRVRISTFSIASSLERWRSIELAPQCAVEVATIHWRTSAPMVRFARAQHLRARLAAAERGLQALRPPPR